MYIRKILLSVLSLALLAMSACVNTPVNQVNVETVPLTQEESSILEAIGGDLEIISEANYANEVTEIIYHTNSYTGRVVQLEGIFSSNLNGDSIPYVHRTLVNEGIETVCGLPLLYLEKEIQDNAWIRVSGIVNIGEVGGKAVAVLEVIAIESLAERGKEVLEWSGHTHAAEQNTEWDNPFTDINKTDDYYAAIEFVYEKNLFRGTSDSTFSPKTTMTRGMFVTVLGRLFGANTAAYTETSFEDVVLGEYYAPYVAWASENGIAKGYGDGTYGVNDEVTVEQAIVFISRLATLYDIEISFTEIDFTQYEDVKSISDWALTETLWALDNGIYDADGAIVNPQGKAERWLVAEMIYNLCTVYMN